MQTRTDYSQMTSDGSAVIGGMAVLLIVAMLVCCGILYLVDPKQFDVKPQSTQQVEQGDAHDRNRPIKNSLQP